MRNRANGKAATCAPRRRASRPRRRTQPREGDVRVPTYEGIALQGRI